MYINQTVNVRKGRKGEKKRKKEGGREEEKKEGRIYLEHWVLPKNYLNYFNHITLIKDCMFSIVILVFLFCVFVGLIVFHYQTAVI